MNRLSFLLIALFAFFSLSLTSCEAIGSIFKAGMWTGVIGIALVVLLILFFIGRARR